MASPVDNFTCFPGAQWEQTMRLVGPLLDCVPHPKGRLPFPSRRRVKAIVFFCISGRHRGVCMRKSRARTMHMLTWARSHQGSRFLCKFLLLFLRFCLRTTGTTMRDRNMQAKRTSVQLLSADVFSVGGRVVQDVCCAWVTYLIINTGVHGGRWHNHNRESAASSRKQWPGERESAMNDAAS